jgi:SAM-dependent methyltransferase
MDLSPVQPTEVPDNCEFRVGDWTESLDDFNDGSFDLIHSRYNTKCVNADDRIVGAEVRADQWDRYINDVYRLLKPGNGWAQFGEIQSIPIWDDDSVPPGSLLARVPLFLMY